MTDKIYLLIGEIYTQILNEMDFLLGDLLEKPSQFKAMCSCSKSVTKFKQR